MKITTILATLALACLASVSQAQWNSNTITYQAPTSCTSGQPIANCPVTGYRIERSATQTGTYAAVGTSSTLTFTHNGAAAGLNCYRVIALSAQGDSPPSTVTSAACKTNVEPSGPPNPPTNVTVVAQVTQTISAPVYRIVGRYPNARKGDFVGLVPVGRDCTGPVLFRSKGYSFRAVILKPSEAWQTDVPAPAVAAAPCVRIGA